MENFIYNLPTRIIFGKQQIEHLSSELTNQNVKRMLLVYGQQSIKKLGIYDHIINVAAQLGIEVIEESGVRPNPDITSVHSGRKKAIEHDVDFILAAGGGSAIDAGKAIAFARYMDSEAAVWKAFRNEVPLTKALPIGTILTLAATGTETNGNTVISNDALKDKRSVRNPMLMPVFSIIDPEYTKSVPAHHIKAGSIDIMMHVFEQFFSKTPRTETSDYMSTGLIKSVIENTRRILGGEDDYAARANISWASTLALCWVLQQGKVGDWGSHRLSYPITTDYGITHGLALAIIQPAWMYIALRENPEPMRRRLGTMGRELFGIENPEDVIEAFKNLYREFGVAATFSEAGVTLSEQDVQRMAAVVTELGPIGNTITVDYNLAMDIFNAAK